jgi:hypothetical protein
LHTRRGFSFGYGKGDGTYIFIQTPKGVPALIDGGFIDVGYYVSVGEKIEDPA